VIIWYLNHYATPPHEAFPGRPYNLARYFNNSGHRFINFCASFHHLRKSAAASEDIDRLKPIDGVPHYYLKTTRYSGNGMFRIMNMLEYTYRVSRLDDKIHAGILEKPDIVIPSCVHLFSFLAAAQLKKKADVKIIFEVRDIWPLSLVELAGISKHNPLIIWMRHIERKAYREADAVVSLLPKAMDHMQPLGLDPQRFHYIPNGVSRAEWDDPPGIIPENHRKIFDWCKQNDKLIVLYTGAHGTPNALDQIFGLKEMMPNDYACPFHFVLIGEGAAKTELIKQARDQSIDFVSFLPRVTKDIIRPCIDKADICFMSLQDSTIFRFGVSPNKLGDYFMAGKPVLYAVNAGNDPVQDAGAGISVQPYHAHQLHEALKTFCSMPAARRQEMGARGKKYALQNLEWNVLGEQYLGICKKLMEI
jgi:glycosyltransferase involved in cell wall biosynthesis